MRLLEILTNHIAKKNDKKLSDGEFSSLLLFCFVSLCSITYFVVYAVVSLFLGDYITSSISALSSLAIFVNYKLYFSKARPLELHSNILIGIVALILLFMTATMGISNNGFVFVFIFPVISLCIRDLKTGFNFSLIFLAAIIAIMISSNYIAYFPNYSISLSLVIIGIYVFVFLLIYIIESIKLERLEHLTKKNLENSIELKKKDEFISNLSHQIRTPLNNITMISTLVNKAKFAPDQRDLFETIMASTNNLVNVVNKIVKISSTEIEDSSLSKINFNLDTAIRNTLRLFESQNKDSVKTPQ